MQIQTKEKEKKSPCRKLFSLSVVGTTYLFFLGHEGFR
jgi:hypothetical protein